MSNMQEQGRHLLVLTALLLLDPISWSHVASAQRPAWQAPTNRTEWGSRVVYQVLVDRLSRNGDATTRLCPADNPSCTFNTYTGGTWLGVTKSLDYIQNLGVDAVWFSPIQEQTRGRTWEYPDGYHGYWPRDINATNSHFGTAQQLEEMIDSIHNRGMWAMLDVVPNHSGYGETSSIAIFNESQFYHTCDGCMLSCSYSNNNDQSVRQCRLSMLPDLDQDHPYVAEQLLTWHKEAYHRWHIDGYRVDAARHVEIDWLNDLRTNISIFTVGEFATTMDVIYTRLKSGALDSSLNFPLADALKAGFGQGDMSSLVSTIRQTRRLLGPENWKGPQTAPLNLLGNFVENHDDDRFLCKYNDIRMYENAHAYVLFAEGFPIIYYGAELGMRGVRDPLWLRKYQRRFRDTKYTQFEMWKFLQVLVGLRTEKQVWRHPLTYLNVSGPYASSILAFERAGVLVVLNNLPPSAENNLQQPVTIKLSGINATSGIINQTLRSALFEKVAAGSSKALLKEPTTVTVEADGTVRVVLSPGRWPQVFSNLSTEGITPFTAYPKPINGLGPDGIALVVFWTVSGVLAGLLYAAMAGWFWKIRPLRTWLLSKSKSLKQREEDSAATVTTEADALKTAEEGGLQDGDDLASAHKEGELLAKALAAANTYVPNDATQVQNPLYQQPMTPVVSTTAAAHDMHGMPASHQRTDKKPGTAHVVVASKHTAPREHAVLQLDRSLPAAVVASAADGTQPAAAEPRHVAQPTRASAAPDDGLVALPAELEMQFQQQATAHKPKRSSGSPPDSKPGHKRDRSLSSFQGIGGLAAATAAAAGGVGLVSVPDLPIPFASIPDGQQPQVADEATIGQAGAHTKSTAAADLPTASGREPLAGSALKDGYSGASAVHLHAAKLYTGKPPQLQLDASPLKQPSLVPGHTTSMPGMSPDAHTPTPGAYPPPHPDTSPHVSPYPASRAAFRELAQLPSRRQIVINSAVLQSINSINSSITASHSQLPAGVLDAGRVPPSPSTAYMVPAGPSAGFSPAIAALQSHASSDGAVMRRSVNSSDGGLRRSINRPSQRHNNAPYDSHIPAAAIAAGLIPVGYLQVLQEGQEAETTPEPARTSATVTTSGRTTYSSFGNSQAGGGQGNQEGHVPGAIHAPTQSGESFRQRVLVGGIPRSPSGVLTATSAAHPAQSSQVALLASTLSAPLVQLVAPIVPEGLILHVAMEYSIPHLGFNSQFMYGGLGKVVDIFLREWRGPIGLCCPLYSEAYNDHKKDHAPKFLPPETQPALTFSVTVSRRLLAVQLFIHQHENVTYFFIQADIFKHRTRATIYAFEQEEEMLTWISVMGQATSVVISTFGIKAVQYHDWHGTVSLMYLPVEVRPMVLLVLHNAHYDGTFPVPDQMRQVYVYSMFDLDVGVWPNFLEHKGCVDMLHGVLTWLRTYQQGVGVVAVSERYAELIYDKIDVMWQLRKRDVVGIMNALPFSQCLAHDVDTGKRTVEDVVQVKAESKAHFQERFGLNIDPNAQLVVFLGRMTHQKGCDIIALAAKDFLKENPEVQLVMVGPVGDATGAEAQSRLVEVAQHYPGRVVGGVSFAFISDGAISQYAPPGKYFSGEEKELLLAAADFCLVPSRFEPCGLVDIEFGWNGALMIGHNTGGLGKMPGVYYTVESSARQHLAACLARAVNQAMRLSPEERRVELELALARRFSTDVMMERYAARWAAVEAACEANRAEMAALQEQAAALAGKEFFSQLWRKHNLQDVEAHRTAQTLDRGRVLKLIKVLTGIKLGRHDISHQLLLVLQAFCQLPMLMVGGLVVSVYVGFITIEGCQSQWDASWGVFPDMVNALGFRVMIAYAAYTVAAPVWTILAMRMRPSSYVYFVVWCVMVSAIISHACMYWTVLINPAIVITSIVAPTGLPIMSLNFLGKSLEVSETGLKYMTVVEGASSCFTFAAALLAALSTNNLGFIIVNGFTVLAAALYVAWFTAPDVLHPAYRHVRLVFKRQWRLVSRITSFWLTSIIVLCENVALVLTAYATLLQWNIVSLMALVATTFGARVLAILCTYFGMQLRIAQLHVQTLMLVVATLPGFAVAKQLAVTYASGFSAVLITVAIVEFVYGSRFQLVGLLAFQTLPSREVVAIWQLATLVVSTIVPFVVLALGWSIKTNYSNTTDLLVAVAVCEIARLAAMAGLWKVHRRENLSTL